MKKTIATILGIVLLSFAGASQVSALSSDDIASKIQALMAQIASLQEQIKVLQTVVPSGSSSGPSVAPAEAPASCKVWYDGCNTCSRSVPGGPLACTELACIWNAGAKCTEYFPGSSSGSGGVPRLCAFAAPFLARGMNSDAVSAVQEFLVSEGLLSQATGYFGPATEAAVRSWQVQQGIVSSGSAATTGWGTIGQRTWEGLRRRCADVGIGDVLKASPKSGAAPLTVSFTAEAYAHTWTENGMTVSVADRGDRYLDFGDGSPAQKLVCTNATASTCRANVSHTYTTEGSYTAILFTAGYFGMQNDTTYGTRSDVARQTIVVGAGGGSACTREYAPVCGRPSGCANTCPAGMYCTMMCQLHEPQTYSNKCMLKAAGAEYLYDGACRDWSANKPPVVSGLSGPTTLSVNETGTWRVTASDPENQSLSYAVYWGDEHIHPMAMMDKAVSSAAFYQDTTFTHSYATAGTYTITIVATDPQGQSAKTSTTVRVGATPIACTMEYAPVCGQKSVCPACTASNPPCMAACYLQQQTYGNRCMMQGDGATFVREGECAN